jgi:hypothetical protein
VSDNNNRRPIVGLKRKVSELRLFVGSSMMAKGCTRLNVKSIYSKQEPVKAIESVEDEMQMPVPLAVAGYRRESSLPTSGYGQGYLGTKCGA